MTILSRAALALALATALAGCQTVTEAPAATPMPKPAVSEPAVPAHDNLNATAWVQSSVEARMAHRQAWRSAERLLDAALADPSWDALAPGDRVAPVAGLPPAIIVDVDETVLDNSPYQVRLIRDGGAFDDGTWNAWVDEARATAVAGAPEFAQAAARRGITMIYLTNREHAKSAVTRSAVPRLGLRNAGLRAEGQRQGLPSPVRGAALPRADAVRRPAG
jgi:acid phosphatase